MNEYIWVWYRVAPILIANEFFAKLFFSFGSSGCDWCTPFDLSKNGNVDN